MIKIGTLRNLQSIKILEKYYKGNNLMLKNVLSFDTENPGTSLSKLAELQQAKVALNGVMKFVDSQ